MQKERLEQILSAFPAGRIMVVGDVMLDEYVKGSVERISPEAPIPVVNLHNGASRDVRLGGAANVFNNIAALGNRNVLLCGVVGDDADGALVRERITTMGADPCCLITEPSRPTTIKTRIIAHNQQVIRLDREDRSPVSSPCRKQLAERIISHADRLDAIIFSDYEKGVITPELLQEVLPQVTGRPNLIVAVDPKNPRYLPATKTLDLHLDRIFDLGRYNTLRLSLDCFNALNAKTITNVDPYQHPGQVTGVLNPSRRLRVGISYEF